MDVFDRPVCPLNCLRLLKGEKSVLRLINRFGLAVLASGLVFFLLTDGAKAQRPTVVTTYYPPQPVVTYLPERRGLFGQRIVYRPALSYAAPVVSTVPAPPPVVVAPAPVTTYYAPSAAVTTYYAPPAPVTTYYAPAAPVVVAPAPVTVRYPPPVVTYYPPVILP
jgi:hypothetical protein